MGSAAGERLHAAVFYLDDTQKTVAEKLLSQLGREGFRVVTGVVRAGVFWPAEEYHQDSYEKKGRTPYCHGPTAQL